MNKLANARNVEPFAANNKDFVLRVIIRCFFVLLGEVYFWKSQGDYFLREKQ